MHARGVGMLGVVLAAGLWLGPEPAHGADPGPFLACLQAGGNTPAAQRQCRDQHTVDLPAEILDFGTVQVLNSSGEWLVTELLVRRRGGACDGVIARSGFLPYPGHDHRVDPSHAAIEPMQLTTLVWDFRGCPDKQSTLTEFVGDPSLPHAVAIEIITLKGVTAPAGTGPDGN